MKILVLEDNERLANLIKVTLEQEDFKTDVFYDGEEALNAINNGYHCYVLDINVPSVDGISILDTIRMYHKNVPVIIISSNHELDNIQKAYEIGADDYLKKPFFNYELVQKIKKFCRSSTISVINLTSGYVFNYENSRLYDDKGKEIPLAKKEILFFELFVKNRQRIVTFNEMEEYIWEGEDTSILNIRALIKRLRKKLPENAIKIVKEIGYALN
ncbi:MAG: response regulator transcription factor [Campylobacteraceae bacterium]|jgi:DNA-binding response OmpR family regulator|nr:response regulator transcription factor [Campylobacteraceae bacterium]